MDLIESLKCSITPGGCKCRNDCRYIVREVINPEFNIPADEIVDGIGYWVSCDCDRMVEDAIEELTYLRATVDAYKVGDKDV